MIERELAHEIVQRLCRHSRLHQRRQRIEVLGRQPPGPAHAFESLGPMQLDRAVAQRGLVGGNCLILIHRASM